MSKPVPPEGLSEAMASFWSYVNAEFDIDEHHRLLLGQACHAFDRAEQARLEVDRDGVTVEGQGGVRKQHPACLIEQHSRSSFAALIRQIGLDEALEALRPGRR